MTRTVMIFLFVLALAVLPASSRAATLSSAQANAIIALLETFDVDTAVIARVEHFLAASVASSRATVDLPQHISPAGNVYPAAAIGYDLSYRTNAYPTERFGFAIVSVASGKAFAHNPRISSEYAWAQLASAVEPTLYLNLNAPYGSTVAGHTEMPQDCTNASVPVSASAFRRTVASEGTGAYPEPSVCAAYNYGYAAADDAYAYAASAHTADTFWWLDVEEANSWSANPAVNDATIQGALDYLNAKGIKAGIYSTPSMWRDIAGDSFTPHETADGVPFPVPTWLPIGINTRVGALNACVTKTSFISGSPIWLLQYELDHAAVDQNVAC